MVDEDDEVDSDIDQDLLKLFGVFKVDIDKGKFMYFGQELWYIILVDILEVKQYFIIYKKEFELSYECVRLLKFMIV